MATAKASLPDVPVRIVEDGDAVRLRLAGNDVGLDLRAIRHDTLTLARALEIPSDNDLIVRFRRASPDAKRNLQERRIPYASDEGEIFVLDPPVAIQQQAPRRKREWGGGRHDRAPFATKASRVSRWLLLHPRQAFNVRQLARHTNLSEGAVSTTVRELHERLMVEVTRDPDDARARSVRLVEPMQLLNAWERAWELRRVRTTDWDVGTHNVDDTLRQVREAATLKPSLRWAVGGTAAAARIVRAVEPADVLLWVGKDDLAEWEDLLVPAPGRGRRGTLRLAFAPDPYIFELAETHDQIPVADPVQIYLDTSREGERALEAADAIRRLMRW
ncbi:MAG TPA: helix-turn-helix domain-containing protein [Thermoleophilaceae bacterium]|nr:helix-turn-helix domain-containing protein [Thermoleophilaceae bacterium]